MHTAMTRLAVALDVPEFLHAQRLIDALAPLGVTFKIGYETFYGYGDRVRAYLEERDASYCLDLKLHDIPRTVEAAMHALIRPGVALVTLHALGGAEMMAAAVYAAEERASALGIATPRLLGVTVLTSIAPEALNELGLQGGPGENVVRLAALARDARFAGVVCSVSDVADLRTYFGEDFVTFCPGIRPAGSDKDDQQRIATPAQARAAGAHYAVVGRPITAAADPVAAAQAILAELAGTPV
jgi:orotidine-5'-phosphate decarboxylase